MYIECVLYMSHKSSKVNRNATVYSMNQEYAEDIREKPECNNAEMHHSFSLRNFTNAFLCTRPAYSPFWRTHRYRRPNLAKH